MKRMILASGQPVNIRNIKQTARTLIFNVILDDETYKVVYSLVSPTATWQLNGLPVDAKLSYATLTQWLNAHGYSLNESDNNVYAVLLQIKFPDKVIGRYTVTGKDYDELFRNGYKYSRELRYMNGYGVKYQDPDIDVMYRQWLKSGKVDIDLYYGGGVVD